MRAEHKDRWLARHVERLFERLKGGYARGLAATLRFRPGVYAVWITLSLLIIPLYMFSAKELAPIEDQSVVFGAIDVPANASLEQVTTYSKLVNDAFKSTPEFEHSFQISFPDRRFRRHVAQVVAGPETERVPIEAELNAKLMGITGIRAPVFLPPALPNPGLFPIELVISSTAEHKDMVRFADELVMAAATSGQFAFPPIVDVRIDQATTEIVVDRSKAASMGLTMGQLGADISSVLSGNFVNRFSMDGRSYKVIPQIQRASRLTPAPARQHPRLGSERPADPAQRDRDPAHGRRAAHAQSLSAAQRHQGLRRRDAVARGWPRRAGRRRRRRILPQGYHLEYTGESRQLRQEGGKFLPAMGLALLVIFLVLAAQFNSFRDPFVILAGSVPLAMFGALIFTFLKFQGPPGMSFKLTEGWTTTLNIYSQVGLVTLAGLIAKNGILIVQFANAKQLEGLSKIDAVREAASIRLRPILMTTVATVAGHFPLTLVSGPGAGARNSIGLVLVGGMTIGTIFTLFVVPSVYVLIAKDHSHEREKQQALDAAAAKATAWRPSRPRPIRSPRPAKRGEG